MILIVLNISQHFLYLKTNIWNCSNVTNSDLLNLLFYKWHWSLPEYLFFFFNYSQFCGESIIYQRLTVQVGYSWFFHRLCPPQLAVPPWCSSGTSWTSWSGSVSDIWSSLFHQLIFYSSPLWALSVCLNASAATNNGTYFNNDLMKNRHTAFRCGLLQQNLNLSCEQMGTFYGAMKWFHIISKNHCLTNT